jgi:type IV pili sensor histidine kinase/response regulator
MDKNPFLPSAALLSALLLAGCAHQSPGPSLEPSHADALEISLPTLNLDGVSHHAVATGPNPPTTVKAQPDIYRGDTPRVEVIRTGRYQLVATQPLLGQRHLLEQTVDVRIPTVMNTSVEDALEHTLRDTGVSLCPAPGPAQRMLYRMPLPASHHRLGPMALREALQVLGGKAWELELDPVAREVCYQVRDIRYVPEPGEGGEVIAEVRDE